jgi:uncharacterized Zn finger protein
VSERIDPVIEDLPSDDLRAFVHDVLAETPKVRQQFLSRFGDGDESVETYREEIQLLFEQHTLDSPVVTTTIDFSRFFELAARYRDRGNYGAAATIYRAVFEAIDENSNRIDAAYDHYAETVQSALDNYVECVLESDPSDEEFEQYTSVLEDRTAARPSFTSKPFQRSLDELRSRR